MGLFSLVGKRGLVFRGAVRSSAIRGGSRGEDVRRSLLRFS